MLVVTIMFRALYHKYNNPQYPLNSWNLELVFIFGGQIAFLQILGFNHWIAQLIF